jgi:putative acetyltransferase
MTTWAPHCSEETVARFREEDLVGQYLDACLEQINMGLLAGQVVAAMHLDGDHLAALHVEADLKGRGIGSIMMAEAEARGARRLEVRAFNRPAIRFYEGRGWQRIRTYEGDEMGTPMLTHEYRWCIEPRGNFSGALVRPRRP